MPPWPVDHSIKKRCLVDALPVDALAHQPAKHAAARRHAGLGHLHGETVGQLALRIVGLALPVAIAAVRHRHDQLVAGLLILGAGLDPGIDGAEIVTTRRDLHLGLAITARPVAFR